MPGATMRPAAANPFTGVPLGDWIRDGAALICLFAALGMPWDGADDLYNKGSDRWWVIIAVLLSVGSLAVPYLARVRGVHGWTYRHFQLLKLGLNAPMLACLVGALVNEVLHLDENSAGFGVAGGFGTGVAMALTGACLAVQPRQADEDPVHRDDRGWNALAAATLVLAAALPILTYLAFALQAMIEETGVFDDPESFILLTMSTLAVAMVIVVWPALSALSGSAPWSRVYATIGFTFLAVAMFSLMGNDDGDAFFDVGTQGTFGIGTVHIEHWNTPTAGVFAVTSAAALVLSRPRQRLAEASGIPAFTGWVRTAQVALIVAGLVLVVTVLGQILSMVFFEDAPTSVIVLTVLLATIGCLCFVGASMLGDVRRNQVLILGLLGAVMLLTMITMGVIEGENIGFSIAAPFTAAGLTLPALAICSILIPKSVRGVLGPLVTAPQPPQAHPGGPTAGSWR